MAAGDACELWSALAAGIAAGFSFMGTRCAGAAVLARSAACVSLSRRSKGTAEQGKPRTLGFTNPKPAEIAGCVAKSRNLLCSSILSSQATFFGVSNLILLTVSGAGDGLLLSAKLP